MAKQGVRTDQAADSGDEPGTGVDGGSAPSGGAAPTDPGAKDAPGTRGVPSDGAGGSPSGSEGPPPSAGTDENPLGDPKDGPPTDVDDGSVEGLVGAGGSGGGGGGGLFGGIADAADDVGDALDDAGDQAADAADDVADEVVETYEDASKLDHQGEHWGGLAGTPDEAIGAVLDAVDPDHRLEDFNRDSGAAIDKAARDAGDAFRDAGDAVNEVYDDSGAGDAIADAREAGAPLVPDVVEDVYDQGEDLAHQTYGDVVEEVVETYEDASYFETKGEHWGGVAGTPDHWLDPLVDGAENVAETPGDWYDKSGVEGLDFGAGADGDGAGDSGDSDGDDDGFGSGAPRHLLADDGRASGAEETAELAGEEEALRVTDEVSDLVADPGPVEVPDDVIEAPEPIEAPDVIEAADPIEPEAVGDVAEVIEPV